MKQHTIEQYLCCNVYINKEFLMSKVVLMTYLEEFRRYLSEDDLGGFFKIWEEYCLSDEIDSEEFVKVLLAIQGSSLAKPFGQFADTALSLMPRLKDREISDQILKIILDLQTTNTQIFADAALELLERRYSSHRYFSEMIHLVGLRQKRSFQRAISNFELLAHLQIGNFVFHTGGWGVGEIMEASFLREHIAVEFEGISQPKDLSFTSAMANLIPLSKDHFLARRFGNPDLLEKEGKKDPLMLIKLLLRDLGPKNAVDIKEELAELVIPESEWAKWWQTTRAKIKKDTEIQSPNSLKDPFVIRKESLSHNREFLQLVSKPLTDNKLILTIYNFTRDFPEIIKDKDVKKKIEELLLERKQQVNSSMTRTQLALQFEIGLLLELLLNQEGVLAPIIEATQNFAELIDTIEIVAFKKKLLMLIRKREDWQSIFISLLFLVQQNQLRDAIFKELLENESTKPLLHEKCKQLLHQVTLYPESFFWYFQKILADASLPFGDAQGRRIFLEASCILLHYVENKPEQKELAKKLHQFLCGKKYLCIRQIIENSSSEFLKEFLLLASKCYTFSKHDMKILHSLAEVVQPEMKVSEVPTEEIIWTTAEGYRSTQEKIQHIGTVEILENAKEIERARAYGDLRENSEYKFALEKRARLQGELKMLTRQLNSARILTPADIPADYVAPGSVVELSIGDSTIVYTLLGPWDSDVENNILSFQSKIAQAMLGKRVGDAFEFQEKNYTILSIKSFLDQP